MFNEMSSGLVVQEAVERAKSKDNPNLGERWKINKGPVFGRRGMGGKMGFSERWCEKNGKTIRHINVYFVTGGKYVGNPRNAFRIK